MLSKIPCMRFKAAEATRVSKFYLHDHIKEAYSKQTKSSGNYVHAFTPEDVSDLQCHHQQVQLNKQHMVQPMNTAGALSLTADPVQDRVYSKRLIPRALAALMDDCETRGPGRVSTTADEKNTIRVRERVVGLDGAKLNDRVFRSALERRRHNQRKRRALATERHNSLNL